MSLNAHKLLKTDHLIAADYILKIKIKLVYISTKVILFSSTRDENG